MKLKFNGFLAMLLLLMAQLTYAQDKSVSGTVTDQSGLPLPGVNVLVKGTQNGTQTDFDGKFKVADAQGKTLVFSFTGMKTMEASASNGMKVKMADDSAILDEVVVIGYGVQKRNEVTSSITRIKGDDMKGLVTPSFESQLAGRASGVQVTSPTGIIGQAPRIRIRGVGSITSGTEPLYVVDGMPIYSGDSGSYTFANSLGDINPNDIESFDILKDGAATAIYGSRGANGVVLITTKKGKKGDAKISYSSTVGFNKAIETFDLLNTEQFLTIANEKRTNAGQPAWAVGNQYDTDWQAAVLNNRALQLEHSLSLSGANDKTNYYMSIGYNTQEGVAKSNSMDRYTFKTNLEHKVNSWFSLGGNVGLTKTDYSGLNVGRGSISGNIFSAIRQLPNTPIYDASNPTGYNINLANGNVGQGTNLQGVGANLSNIVYVLDKNKFESQNTRILLNTFLSADLAKGLNYRLQASVDKQDLLGYLYWNPTHGDGRRDNINDSGRIQNDNTSNLRWNIQNILTYNKTLFENHNFATTFVAEYQKERNQFYEAAGTGLANEFYDNGIVTGAYGVQTVAGGITEEGLSSYLGRLSYNYKQKYFLQGSLRRDGLSKFSPDTRWEYFTGYSAGWDVAKESFMSSLSDKISSFKLRASYSEVGNTGVPGSYPYRGLTSASQYGAANGIGYTQFGNDQLRWETSRKTDFGIDFSILRNRIKFTFDYFKNDQDGLVLRVPVGASLGLPGIAGGTTIKNVGAIENKGQEFGIDASIIDTEDFKWSVNANLTLQKSLVTSLPSNNADILPSPSTTDINVNPNIIIRHNESPNSLYGFEYWGVNSANGNPVYVKADGSLVQGNIATQTYVTFDPNNPTNVSTASNLTAADRKVLGNTLPTYFGGFSSNLSYKNFDFGFLVRFSGGNKIFNATRREMLNQDLNNNSTEIIGRWQSPSEPGDGVTPRLWAGRGNFINQTSATSRFVENGDFISLDNVSFGYSCPKSLTERIKVDRIRFYVQLQNMFIITDYKGLNPEMETFGVDLNGSPRAKSMSVGINVNL
jgi:TonB-linked SusC/RagA family outer membrane protein